MPSAYAEHLMELATALQPRSAVAGFSIARRSRLAERVHAILDARRHRRAPGMVSGLASAIGVLAVTAVLAAQQSKPSAASNERSAQLRAQQLNQLKSFSARKAAQGRALFEIAKQENAAAESSGADTRVWKEIIGTFTNAIYPEFAEFFNAATNGNAKVVTNLYSGFKQRHPQYERGKTPPDVHLRRDEWQCVLETALAYYDFTGSEPQFLQLAVDGFVNSIPAGSIYFGGTDSGRGIPTAFSKTHEEGDPFFTITQNALADGTYLQYVRRMYGKRLKIPSAEESQKCFQDYMADAQNRIQKGQLRPGEDVRVTNGIVHVSGQVSVMSINGCLAKNIFEQNPDRDFYLEESFPIDWMYPHLEPHGLVMKLNRTPLEHITDEVIRRDAEYWRGILGKTVGSVDTSGPMKTYADFVTSIHLRGELTRFTGDTAFLRNNWAQMAFSKWRSAVGGLYAWRAGTTKPGPDRERMIAAAERVFREAFALCPKSPEALYRYVNLLAGERRYSDALLIAETANAVQPQDQTKRLIEELKKLSNRPIEPAR